MVNEVYVLYNGNKLRAVYATAFDALMDQQRLVDRGFRDARVQEVQLQNEQRETDPLDPETIDALKRCVERS